MVEKSSVRLMPRSLLVKVTCGADDPERCNQGLTLAAAGIAAGADVGLWLTGEAAWLGVPGRAEVFALPHAAPLADLLATAVELGDVVVCTQCAARRGLAEADLLDGIRVAGAAEFVERALTDGTQALVY
jgi:predicted peroxiredoxin